uniref:uncharacterized protein LOC117160008 n=1 Tax=Bombus vancouverensis nearcticus TaxID=2705178 RepID=UPI00143A999C|nr:uncharacterized protein LOC117160008 [Bombus vancouverensis nearcticus]
MGHSKYESNSKIKLNLLNKEIEFALVDDNFPIIEDGILGLPALNQYRFELSNKTLKLDNNTLLLQQEPTLASGEIVQKIVYFEGKPTPVCFINGEYFLWPPSPTIHLTSLFYIRKARLTSSSKDRPQKSGLCYYQETFRDRARKCRAPCNWTQ